MLLLSFSGYAQIQGIIVNEQQEPLPGALVLLLPDSISEISDHNGFFRFQMPDSRNFSLEVRFLGYHTWQQSYTTKTLSLPLRITLTTSQQLLETILITTDHAKQENTLATDHLILNALTLLRGGTFVQAIEKLPGISAINVGTGIAKPVIRGLSFNRIIINSQGIKQEGQQWGADHGLEIDQFDADHIEIIKGPASLQYGSDGLGGVINILPGPIPTKNSFSGNITGLYKSNNQHFAGSAYAAVNKNDWFATARFSLQDYASFRVPASSFVFNGFVLPIFNNTLINTGGNERNLSLNLGRKTTQSITRLTYSLYELQAGFFPGAIGIPRSYALAPRDNNRVVSVPSQQVNHHKLSLSKLVFWGDHHAELNLGYQHNLRREFSFPENHNRFLLADPNDRLAIQLQLQTYSANAHIELNPSNTWKQVFGLNAQYQTNQRSGFEFLIPDFNSFRGGIFTIHEFHISNRITSVGGLRLDLATNETTFFSQPFFDSRGNVLGFQTAPATRNAFFNYSASWGINYEIVPDQLSLKANAGKSFRAPYPNETSSDGVHHGNFRHELGTPNLQSEHGYQLDLGTDFTTKSLSLSFATYFNYFRNFIYLKPSGRFVFRPDAGQTYQYEQNNVLYSGFEAELKYTPAPSLSFLTNAEYVWNINLADQRALPFTPPPSVRTEIQYNPSLPRSLPDAKLFFAAHYHFPKTKATVAQNEATTPGYLLLETGTSFSLPLGKTKPTISLQAQNLLNTTYLNPLSRYRLINVPEQGRNIILSIKVPFG
jgi:iron complex outermembrane receptor protein